MVNFKYLIFFALLVCSLTTTAQVDTASKPKRVNKCIELLEQGQPVYYLDSYGGYDEGKKLAKTWADYIVYNMEHKPFDFTLLHEFMRGLVEGGPTPSGHRTPTVIAVLPILGLDAQTVRSNGWMVEQALAQGVHGVHLCRARNPGAVKQFIQSVRYSIHKQEINAIGAGLRGWGSQKWAAWVWGIDEKEYLQRADVWPLNPKGELMLGLKIEDREALANAEKTLKVRGIAFAEHGPRDMGLAYGYLDGRADPPVPAEVDSAGQKVLRLCKKYGLYFLDNVLPDNVKKKIDMGVKIGAGSNPQAAAEGRKYTKRKLAY